MDCSRELFRSTRRTRQRRSASKRDTCKPAKPAPITTTSKSFMDATRLLELKSDLVVKRTVFVSDDQMSFPGGLVDEQRCRFGVCGQIERDLGCVRFAGPQSRSQRRAGLDRWPVPISTVIDQCQDAAVRTKQAIAAPRGDRGFVEASLQCDDRVHALRGGLIWRVAEGPGLSHLRDRICEMTIELAKVLFLATGQDLFMARK